MEQAKKSRGAVRAFFNKTIKAIESLFAEDEVDKAEIKLKWDIVQEKQIKLTELNGEIFDFLTQSDEPESSLVLELETVSEYDSKFRKLRNKVQELLDEAAYIVKSSDSTLSETAVRKYKLPVIELKRFGGDIREWLPFWSQFQKIHEDAAISSEDKFQYLRQATIPNSRAREIVDSFPLTKANYVKALDSLRARFGKDELLIEVYVRELLKQNTLSKEKPTLATLYDKLETQLRALETLGVTSEKYEAMLYPLIESALPEEVLRIWQRSPNFTKGEDNKKSRLINLMGFIQAEVKGEQRIALAMEGFEISTPEKQRKSKKPMEGDIPTATGLINHMVGKCIFCDGNHTVDNCFKVTKLSLEEKRAKIAEKKACFRCFKTGHQKRQCRERLHCFVCGKQHIAIMFSEIVSNKTYMRAPEKSKINRETTDIKRDATLANCTGTAVFLQTLRLKLLGNDKVREVRAIIDTGSQRSYILRETAINLRYPVKRSEKVVHALFGGTKTGEVEHQCFEIRLTNMEQTYTCCFEVMDQPVICNEISPVYAGIWTRELSALEITISDTAGSEPIELLIGADIAGKLLTGNRHILKCGLVAIETLLGWTLMGKFPINKSTHSTTMIVTSLLNDDVPIKNLWELDVLGITDPKEKMSKIEARQQALDTFNNSIHVNEVGRYEVRLLWRDEHPPLPSNKQLAKKRLDTTLRKLKSTGYYDRYQQVLNEWLQENIIEEKEDLFNNGHYLPHRPVIKENRLTTKVRPVFDASARQKGSPSLNDCLEKGENLLEVIPNILLSFRKNKIGVISDITKAFLQINIEKSDRDVLRFLWENKESQEIVYRHKRVVFGVNSSPFLLNATIRYHLDLYLSDRKGEYPEDVIVKLRDSFYVDNCVTSVENTEERSLFITKATQVMADGKFELRGWEFSKDGNGKTVSVLGLTWDKEDDMIFINHNALRVGEDEKMSKRTILSVTQKIFDPIGMTAPPTLYPKLLLQSLWEKQVPWDGEVDEETKTFFLKWCNELPMLKEIKMPRYIDLNNNKWNEASLHVFCDASAVAYAATVFLRIRATDKIKIHLLAAKSRVAPMKKISIPRLELLAATIGARLWQQVKVSLNVECRSHFWSDSTTVLSWIKRTEEWSVFVWNRVQEIRSSTDVNNWMHVPGHTNPADLLSRGCSPRALVSSRWWEGPLWLYQEEARWPTEQTSINEDEVLTERKKGKSKVLLYLEVSDKFYLRISSYKKMVRVVAWIYRFIKNCQNRNNRQCGELFTNEVDSAERVIIRLVQKETYGEEIKPCSTLNVFRDEEGILRVRTKLTERCDTRDFICPFLLPAKHPIIKKLILEKHVDACHAKGQCLVNILREKFWVIGGRRTIRSACIVCKACRRQDSKRVEVTTAALPENRVRDAAVFEITGIDFAGPLFLKNKEKAWICLFTCAVYRAVHLELVLSLCTNGFLQALRRFVARRGRPKYIYTDRGTNFVGAEERFQRLNWDEIQRGTTFIERINWCFNPPAAPWWGGFWERLVGSVKQLLKRSLGRAYLTADELYTLLCDCESVMNSRPLTYVFHDTNELIPLTPRMFLNELPEYGVPDIDRSDASSLNRRIKYLQRLRKEIRGRFRSEYLGLLKQRNETKCKQKVSVNDIVLIGSDNIKRLDWPMARVIELIPGRDGVVRLARVKTTHGQLVRPLQRLYPLECTAQLDELPIADKSSDKGGDVCDVNERPGDSEMPSPNKAANQKDLPYTTKYGRIVKKPAL